MRCAAGSRRYGAESYGQGDGGRRRETEGDGRESWLHGISMGIIHGFVGVSLEFGRFSLLTG